MRARRGLLIVPALLLALVLAGCGGGTVARDEVPGGPVTLSVPSDRTAGAAAATPTPSGSATPTPTPSATATPGTGTGTQATATATPASSATGTTPSQTDSPSNDTAPPAGSDAQQFEDFCAQNEGAC
jgi:hypothetical protein